jgi:hypothetical protein
MHCIRYVATAIFVFVGAQAVQLGVHDASQRTAVAPVKGVLPSGGMLCNVDDECSPVLAWALAR